MEIFAVHGDWDYDEKERERQKKRIQKGHKHHPLKSSFIYWEREIGDLASQCHSMRLSGHSNLVQQVQ